MSNRDQKKDSAQMGSSCLHPVSHGPAQLNQADGSIPHPLPLSRCRPGGWIWVAGVFCLFFSIPSATIYASESNSSEKQRWAESAENRRVNIIEPPSELQDASTEIKRISKHVQTLKTEVIDLNNELRLMEEQLLFPSGTKYSIFVSLSSGQFFTLESVRLVLNGKVVATHIYSENQRQAMLRGGIHRMYVTNLNEGKHSATAFFTGIGPNGREYKRASNIDFEKGPGSKYLELAVGDDAVRQEPVFAIKQW